MRTYGKRREPGTGKLKSVCKDCKKMKKCGIRTKLTHAVTTDVAKLSDISVVMHIENCPVMEPINPGQVLIAKYPSVGLR